MFGKTKYKTSVPLPELADLLVDVGTQLKQAGSLKMELPSGLTSKEISITPSNAVIDISLESKPYGNKLEIEIDLYEAAAGSEIPKVK